MDNKIKYIIGFPRSRAKYGYYVNNNLKDKHIVDRDDFYFFVAKMLRPPSTVKLREYIDRNRYFIVDIDNNLIKELYHESEEKTNRKEGLKKIFKSYKKEQKKKQEKKEDSYDEQIQSLFKKLDIK